MSRWINGLRGLVMALGVFVSLPAMSQVIKVYTDAEHPVQVGNLPNVAVITLDRVVQAEQALSEKLSDDPHKAEAQARALLQSSQGQAAQQELMDAYAGIVQAWHENIVKVPAVVMDGYVVYGQPDVSMAVQAIEQFKARGRP